MSRPSSSSLKKDVLTTPLDFRKVRKPTLLPPSQYSQLLNKCTSSSSTANSSGMKTPQDFATKPASYASAADNRTKEKQSDGTNIIEARSMTNLSRNEGHVLRSTNLHVLCGGGALVRNNSFPSLDGSNLTLNDIPLPSPPRRKIPNSTHPSKLTTESAPSSTRSSPKPVLPVSNSVTSVSQAQTVHTTTNTASFTNCLPVPVGDPTVVPTSSVSEPAVCVSSSMTNEEKAESVSKAAYDQLQKLYTESQQKFENLEAKFSQITETKAADEVKQKEVQKEADGNFVKQLQDLRRENQLLSGKLQLLEQHQLSDVKGAVDRYLSQNQQENEREAFKSKVAKLEKTVAELEEEKVQLLKEMDNKDEKYEKAMVRNKEERYSYEECIDKLNGRISVMIDENERTRDEKEEMLAKYESCVKTLADVNNTVDTKNKHIEELNAKLKEEREKSSHCEADKVTQKEGFEVALSNIERMLKEEMSINANLDNQLTNQDTHVQTLEQKVRQLNEIIRETSHHSELVKSLRITVASQREETTQLQHLCATLQSANDSLNARVSSLNEIMKMQEPYSSMVNANDANTKLLHMWREKVYSLLVLLKMQDLKTKHTTTVTATTSTTSAAAVAAPTLEDHLADVETTSSVL